LLITNINLLLLLIFFLLLAVFIFILNKLAFKWYKVPTMLLEKVSIHTEILFVHCYKVFFIITCSFSVFVENCILLPMRYKWICCVPVYCTCMVLIFYPFIQIYIISRKGTIFSQNKNYVSEVHFYFQVQKCSIEIFL
jgi:hypothetical protein